MSVYWRQLRLTGAGRAKSQVIDHRDGLLTLAVASFRVWGLVRGGPSTDTGAGRGVLAGH